MKDVKSQDRWARRAVLTLVGGVVVVLVAFLMYGSRHWQVFPRARVVSQPLKLTPATGQQVAQTPCYGLLLSTDFEITTRADCGLNAYARPQKYRYINVSPYYGTRDEAAALAHWRERWLTLQAQEISRDEVTIDGKKAWKLTEAYPQNAEKFITYLVIFPRPVPVDSKASVTALEIRGWASSADDVQFLDNVMQSWQWRL